MKKFFRQRFLSLALSLGMMVSAFACTAVVSVSAESEEPVLGYTESRPSSRVLYDAKKIMWQYVKDQNLPVKSVFCGLRDYDAWDGCADSVFVAYNAQENPEVESMMREFMSENGIDESYVIFYDLSTKITDPDVIYDMICECADENDFYGVFRVYKPGEVVWGDVVSSGITVCSVGSYRTETILAEFIVKNNIDRTQVSYAIQTVSIVEIDPETSKPILPPWIETEDTTDAPAEVNTVEDVTKGDPDGDSEVSILDVVLMNRVVAGVEQVDEIQRKAADVDGDGKITLSDSMKVLQYIVGLITEL
ncbi:MAG: dockerin type I repeat-containing protein [Oscillospiraceae bacterium]|nr:dockerin type I repeat-containing protein [Oscillospiraceae bacterium]